MPYLVEELLEGESLNDRLDRGRPDVAEALRIASEMARGLAVAHESGIVHRDLKPGNVFLTRDGTTKILDFGLAKQVPTGLPDELETATTALGGVLGTVAYMAPEQARGRLVDYVSKGAVAEEAFRRELNLAVAMIRERPEARPTYHAIPYAERRWDRCSVPCGRG